MEGKFLFDNFNRLLISFFIMFQEMHLSHAPKFHVLCEHAPGILRMMNVFFDMGEDMIER